MCIKKEMKERKRFSHSSEVKGCGLIDAVGSVAIYTPTVLNRGIDLLPVELHLPGSYRYCGSGSKLKKRLARGDPRINKMDEACKEHEIRYSKYQDNERRARADRESTNRAWARMKSSDASLGERAAAWAVTNAMKIKSKLGGGVKKKGGKSYYLKPYEGSASTMKIEPKIGGGVKKSCACRKKKGGKGYYHKPYKGSGVRKSVNKKRGGGVKKARSKKSSR